MIFLEGLFCRPEPTWTKVLCKEAWIYWRLCLKLRREKISREDMLEEIEVWGEGASGWLQRKLIELKEETNARIKVRAA